MKLQICSYELSKLANKKGFNWITRTYYNQDDKELDEFIYYEFDQFDYINDLGDTPEEFNNFDKWCMVSNPEFSAPTQDLLAKWLRNTHDISIDINTAVERSKYYFYIISKESTTDVFNWQKMFNDILELAYDESTNTWDDDLYDKLIFEKEFAFKLYEEAQKVALFKALELI